jgi:hypothetical protein
MAAAEAETLLESSNTGSGWDQQSAEGLTTKKGSQTITSKGY